MVFVLKTGWPIVGQNLKMWSASNKGFLSTVKGYMQGENEKE